MKKIYNKGIRFECQGSSNCCVSHGKYGFVYLSKKDLKKIANFFNLSILKFVNKFCDYTDNFLHLKETKKNGDCIFLNNKKCSIYKARPTQCRTWPFWNENMNVKTWNKEIIHFCPGIGKGKNYTEKEINNLLIRDKKNEKKIIDKN